MTERIKQACIGVEYTVQGALDDNCAILGVGPPFEKGYSKLGIIMLYQRGNLEEFVEDAFAGTPLGSTYLAHSSRAILCCESA